MAPHPDLKPSRRRTWAGLLRIVSVVVIVTVTFIVSVIVISIATTTAALAETTRLRLHHFLPANSSVPQKILAPWARNIEQASQQTIKVDLYPSMQLGGKPNELIDQALEGTVDIVWTLPGYTPGRFLRTEVLELPFLITDAGAASAAYWQLMQEDFQYNEFDGLHVLGAWVHSPGVIHSRRPIRKLEDMKNLQIRASTSAVVSLFRAIDAAPVGMPVPAVPEALVRGVIDAVAVPWEVTTSLRIAELVSFHTEFENATLYTATFVLAMNQQRYAQLSQSQQRAINVLSNAQHMYQLGMMLTAEDTPARQVAIDRGNQITILPEHEVQRWKQTSIPAYDDWKQRAQKRGINAERLLEQAKAYITQATQNTNQP